MLFLFGRSIPKDLSQYFVTRAKEDGHRTLFASMGKFASSEAFSELRGISREELSGQPIVVMDSFAQTGDFSANDIFAMDLILGNTLKRYGAGPVWLINPFGPYARQDQEREGKMDSVGCDAIAQALSVNYDGISSVELHSVKAKSLMQDHFGENNVFTIDPTEIFVEDLSQFQLTDPVIVSPDKGANARADALADALDADRAHVDKERKEIINTRITGFAGDVTGRDAIVVDDMADTFGTAGNSLRFIKEKGALRVMFYSAHPVLSGPAWDNLAKLIRDGVVDRVGFGNTIARNAEFENFSQQHGPDIASKVHFLNTGDVLYRHVTETIASHPAMQATLKI